MAVTGRVVAPSKVGVCELNESRTWLFLAVFVLEGRIVSAVAGRVSDLMSMADAEWDSDGIEALVDRRLLMLDRRRSPFLIFMYGFDFDDRIDVRPDMIEGAVWTEAVVRMEGAVWMERVV